MSMKNLFYDFVRAFYAPKSLYKEIHDGRATPSWLCVLIYHWWNYNFYKD